LEPAPLTTACAAPERRCIVVGFKARSEAVEQPVVTVTVADAESPPGSEEA
jgi:hypothetical protein